MNVIKEIKGNLYCSAFAETYLYFPLYLYYYTLEISQPICELLHATNSSCSKQEIFFMNILYIGSFCPQKMHNRTLLFGIMLLKHVCHFIY
jgi:hypothetical protein